MKTTFTIIIVFFVFTIKAQQTSMSYEEMLLDKAATIQGVLCYTSLESLIEEKDSVKSNYAKLTKKQILWNAEEYYDKLIDSFPNSKFIYKAILGKAYINYENEDNENAKKGFLKIYNSKDSVHLSNANYDNYAKYHIAIKLAEISILEKKYDSVFEFVEQGNKHLSQYRYMCLNAYYDDKEHENYLLSKSYIGLNNYEKAYSILIPKMFENGYARESDLKQLVFKSLLQKYNKEELKSKYEESFDNIHQEKDLYRKKKITRFYIIFLNNKVYLPHYEMTKEDKKDRENKIAKIRHQSSFYNYLKS